jgi:ABC-type multidrug transport system fused ATPase/permease subunit
VRENIAYGNPHATEAAVLQAARLADVDEFVRELPEGYETHVGQKGRALSGGQRQRVAIARAILKDAPVLVLDEPTTGLDAESARRVMEPLRRLTAGCTTILISHDPALARAADRVVVLEGGRVAEHRANREGRQPHERRLEEVRGL